MAGLAPNKEGVGVGVGIAGASAGIEAGVAPKPNPEEEEEGALAGVNVGVGVGVAPNEKPPVEGEGAAAADDAVGVPKLKAIGFIYNKQISWVDHQYKLISNDAGQSFELYNLITDRAEKENIIQEQEEIAVQMKKDLLEWISSVENSKQGLDY